MKNSYDLNRLYKETLHKKVSGVCAGIARYFNVQLWLVRLLTVIAFFMFPVPVAMGYFLAAVLLPSR